MISPMLLTETAAPFDDPAPCWQLKWDGIRCVGSKQGAEVRPSGVGTAGRCAFPRGGAAVASGVTADQVIVDGELVVVASDVRPDFYAVMDRHSQDNAERIRRAARTHPVALMVFDVLEVR